MRHLILSVSKLAGVLALFIAAQAQGVVPDELTSATTVTSRAGTVFKDATIVNKPRSMVTCSQDLAGEVGKLEKSGKVVLESGCYVDTYGQGVLEIVYLD